MKLRLLSLTAVATIVLALSGHTVEPVASAVKETSSFAPTISKPSKPPNPVPEGMVWIPGGEFSMGSEGKCDGKSCCSPATIADALPIHRVDVDGFWMDATDVTNAEFAKFVQATGYVTIAERAPTKEEFPTAPPENLVAGSVVFTPTSTPVSLDDHFQWWSYVKGANWRHPGRSTERHQGQRKLSGRANRLSRRGSLREMGGQATAHRSGVGICRARRLQRKALCLGR